MSDFDDGSELIESVARELRAPVVLTPALDERVMAEVRAAPHASRGRPWLLRPMTLQLSPLAGLAAAAGIAGIAVLGAALALRGRADVALPPSSMSANVPDALGAGPATVRSVSTAEPSQNVQFVFLAPGASNVTIVGEFNDWDTAATPLQRVSRNGVWTVTLPLRPGRYTYMFVVDGTQWRPDPNAPTAFDDDFGTPNSVVTVEGPAA